MGISNMGPWGKFKPHQYFGKQDNVHRKTKSMTIFGIISPGQVWAYVWSEIINLIEMQFLSVTGFCSIIWWDREKWLSKTDIQVVKNPAFHFSYYGWINQNSHQLSSLVEIHWCTQCLTKLYNWTIEIPVFSVLSFVSSLLTYAHFIFQLLGSDATCFGSEVSTVDPKHKTLELRTTNVSTRED